MGWGTSTLLAGALGAILLAAGIEDARRREIANWKTATIALLAPFWWWSNGLLVVPDIALQIGLALIVFALFCVAFHFGWMGGGDVKLIGALALWFPLVPFANLILAMAVIGGALTLLMLVERALKRGREGTVEVPYGVAIAIAGLLALREPIFNAFS